jgi:hypothetical protein
VNHIDAAYKVAKVDPLSIDQILGNKREVVTRPYAAVAVPLETGRWLLPLQAVSTLESFMQ